MLQSTNKRKLLKEASPYNAVITREQFLFHEMRITAKLIDSGLEKNDVIEKIVTENLFQYPTEKMIRRMAVTCIRRLDAIKDDTLINAIATQSSDVAKQICLYAMMQQYRLVWDFMVTVIGEKYQKLDRSFGKMDVNSFFTRLQEQDNWVATWSNSTIVKIRQVLIRTLVENKYLDSTKANHLNQVMISPILESAIRRRGITEILPAFDCLV